MEEIVNVLVKRGEALFAQPYQKIDFTRDNKADGLLNDLKNYPHAFVLACVMDRQIRAERAWLIPYEISKEIGGFEFSKLLSLRLNGIKGIFVRKSLHRFNDTMANNFYLAIQRIHENYNNVASNIWERNPKSATVVRRFLQFQGVGIKIASMATNTLARDFKIPMADKLCIDISPDVQVKRVFIRLGLIDEKATNDELLYCARELNPEYPGIFDSLAWDIGKNWCRPKNPSCAECYLKSYCPKIGVSRNSR
jgi:endonuclease III